MNQANVFSYFHGWLGAQPTGVQSPWCCWEGKEGQETVSWPLETYPNANDFENTSILLSCTIEIRSARPARKKIFVSQSGSPINSWLTSIHAHAPRPKEIAAAVGKDLANQTKKLQNCRDLLQSDLDHDQDATDQYRHQYCMKSSAFKIRYKKT